MPAGFAPGRRFQVSLRHAVRQMVHSEDVRFQPARGEIWPIEGHAHKIMMNAAEEILKPGNFPHKKTSTPRSFSPC